MFVADADGSATVIMFLASGGDAVNVTASPVTGGVSVQLSDFTALGINLSTINRFLIQVQGTQTVGPLSIR